MKPSELFKLNLKDLLNGLLMAVLVPVMVIVQQTINAGTLTFDWRSIGMAAVGGAVGYLVKKFFQSPPTA